MKKRRVAGWLLTGLLGLVALLAVALWAGLSSDRVARNLLAKALTRAGDMIEIGRISGTLNGPLILNDVSIRTEVFAATIDSVLLDWTPIGLVKREVRIDRLHVTGLHVVLPDSTPRDTAAPQRPTLPLDVLLGDVVVQDISVDAPGGVGLSDGWARLGGTADEYHLVARGRAFTPQLDSVPFVLDGRGNLEGLALDSARVDLFEGAIAAAGALEWWPRVAWNLDLEAADVHPGLLLEDPAGWRGQVSALARTAGHLDSLGAHGRVIVDSLGGELRGQPLRGSATFDLAGTAIQISELDVGWGSADLEGSGTIAESLDLRFEARIGNLATVMPGSGGALSAAGRVTGPRTSALVSADLSGRNLAMGTNRVARVEGTATIGLAEDGRTDVNLRGSDAATGAVVIERLAVEMRGTRMAHRIQADAVTPDAEVELAARGGLRETTWRGTIARLQVAADALGVWRLERPTALTAAPELVRLAQLCLSETSGLDDGTGDGEPSRICAAGSWRGTLNWSADASVERLPLALLDSLRPDTAQAGGRSLAGALDAEVDVSATAGRLDGLATLRAREAAVLFPVPGDTAPDRLVFDTAAAEVRFGADGMRSSAVLRFVAADGAPVGAVEFMAALPQYTRTTQRLQDQTLEARVSAAVEDLSFAGIFDERIDSLTGRLRLDGTAAGTLGAPRVEASAGLEEIVAWLAGSRVARGSVDATLEGSVANDRSLTGTLSMVPRGVIYEYPLADVRRTVVLDSGGIEVSAGRDGLRGLLALGISDSAGGRMGSFDADLALPQYTRLGQPLAPQPVSLRFTADVAELAVFQTIIAQFDTLSGRLTTNLTVAGTVGAPDIEGTLELRDMVALFPHGSAIVGGLDAEVDASVARDSTITGSLRVVPAGLALRIDEADTLQHLPVDSTGLAVTIGAAGTRADLALRIARPDSAPAAVMGAEVALPAYRRLGTPLGPQAIRGVLAARADDLAFVEGLTAQVDSMAGSLRLDATLGGTVEELRASGEMALENAAARLPLLGVLYENIRVTARADESETFAVDGSLASGGGTLTLSGRSPLVPTAERPATLQVEGSDFEAIHSAEAHAIVSPDLSVTVTGTSADIEGEITIPFARVELADFPELAIAPSDDVVFAQDTTTELTGPRALSARVRVILGDSVVFRGFNFTAELGGRLLYIQEPEEIATASGEVVIEDGRYRAYGQDLTITDGTLRFAGGPVDDPGLDIRAVRTADDGTVAGLQIGGTLQSPDVTIFSQPPMAQSRALAYIILGRAPGEGEGGGGALLSKAATSVGLRGGNALVGGLGEGLGLSQASIEAEDGAGSATFVTGAYLAPNVYVSYGIGLFDSISRLRLRYELSDRWSIQAERGANSGADVLFTTERGE